MFENRVKVVKIKGLNPRSRGSLRGTFLIARQYGRSFEPLDFVELLKRLPSGSRIVELKEGILFDSRRESLRKIGKADRPDAVCRLIEEASQGGRRRAAESLTPLGDFL